MRDDDRDLEAFFASARKQDDTDVSGISAALAERIFADADRLVAKPTAAPVSVQPLWRAALSRFAGWGMAAGLATATVVGLMVGVNSAEFLGELYLGSTGLDDFTTVGVIDALLWEM